MLSGMKRLVALSALMALVFLPSSVRAEADGPDYYRVRHVAANDVLNMRSGPSPSAPKIGEIPHDGDGLRNLGCRGGLTFEQWQRSKPAQRTAAEMRRWCRIEYRGVTGWANARFLAEGGPAR